jgi:hypothetical protein
VSEAVAVDVEIPVGPFPGTGRCLIQGDLTVAELPALTDPRALPTTALPEWLAGLVGLGPRPAVSAPGILIAQTALLDTVLDLATPEPAAVAAAIAPERLAPDWLTLLAGIAGHLAARWRITVGPLDAAPVDALEILDCAGKGLWARQPCPTEVAAAELDTETAADALTPTTSTAVWMWLSRLAAGAQPAW